MNIHEYQAKELMRQMSIPTLDGRMAETVDDAVKAAKELGGEVWAVKAQIHAGGRGKGGGVKIAKSIDQVKKYAEEILGMTLVTHQTGPEGKLVRKIYIEKGCEIDHEFYLGIVLDRAQGKLVMMASSEGGVEIEKVAAETPEKIVKVAIDPSVGFSSYVGRKMAYNIGLKGDAVKNAVSFFGKLYDFYEKMDCTIAEINPLILTKDSQILALDAKLNFDDNALFRHPDVSELKDVHEESAEEIEAAKFDLNYIKLSGNIGCLVNGAGLAMGTMDIIKLYGGEPANFLDVGGSATEEAVENAFKIILNDSNVKGILVNIFGGIMKCDIIAEGIISAAKVLHIQVPLVVRLEGTNVAVAKKMLNESGLKIIAAEDLADAAKKVTDAVKEEE